MLIFSLKSLLILLFQAPKQAYNLAKIRNVKFYYFVCKNLISQKKGNLVYSLQIVIYSEAHNQIPGLDLVQVHMQASYLIVPDKNRFDDFAHSTTFLKAKHYF